MSRHEQLRAEEQRYVQRRLRALIRVRASRPLTDDEQTDYACLAVRESQLLGRGEPRQPQRPSLATTR